MKKPTIVQGIVLGLVTSVVCAALFAAAAPVLGSGVVLRALVALAALVYLGWLMHFRRSRAGGVSAVVLWLAATVLLWFAHVSFGAYVGAYVGLVWLLRSFCHYRGVLPALADLGLCGVSLCAAAWAAIETHSIGLSFWSFFLVQSLVVFIPSTVEGFGRKATSTGNDRFGRAHRSAEAALRRLYSNQ